VLLENWVLTPLKIPVWLPAVLVYPGSGGCPNTVEGKADKPERVAWSLACSSTGT